MAVIAFQTKIDNFMMLAQSESSMKEHHHFEILTIFTTCSTYYPYLIVRQLLSEASGGYR